MSVEQLSTVVQDQTKRPSIVGDCVQLVEDQVRTKGMAVKLAFKMVKAIKPAIIKDSVDALLDEFVEKMQPYYGNYRNEGANGTIESYFGARAADVAESMLGVTDKRAERSTNKIMVKAYKKLRPKGKEHVTIAVPHIGAILDKYV